MFTTTEFAIVYCTDSNRETYAHGPDMTELYCGDCGSRQHYSLDALQAA